MSIADKTLIVSTNNTEIAENISKVYEAGKQAERQATWGALQNNGGAVNYRYTFAYDKFTDETYNPQYPIVCSNSSTGGTYVFYSNKYITDTKVPIYVYNSATSMFQDATALVTIRKLIVTEDVTYSGAFNNCTALENLITEGTIGNGIAFNSCKKLNKASMTSVINALSPTVSGQTLSLPKIAVNNAFGIDVDDETTYPAGSEFYELRHSRDNWTFNYV